MNLLELDVDIRDNKAFEAIDLDKLRDYLTRNDWQVELSHPAMVNYAKGKRVIGVPSRNFSILLY